MEESATAAAVRRVVVGVDGSETSREAVRWAAERSRHEAEEDTDVRAEWLTPP